MERKSKKERKEDLSDLYFRYLIEGKIRAGMGRGTRVHHCRWKEVSRDQRRSFACPHFRRFVVMERVYGRVFEYSSKS